MQDGYHSVFSFADHELENVLNLFDSRMESANDGALGGHYQQQQMHMYQHHNQLTHPHQATGPDVGLDLSAYERIGARPGMLNVKKEAIYPNKRAVGSRSRTKGKNVLTHAIPQRFLPPETKSTVSHSAAEKQRRDRINTLIDELREMVPLDAECEDSNYLEDPLKRPKHVVLSDTIKYVKKTLAGIKVEAIDIPKNSSAKKIHSQHSQQSLNSESLLRRSRDNSDASSEKSDLSEGGNTVDISVDLDQDKNLSVNVLGKDRNGLLHDITRALKALNLEIKHAVIQTRKDGCVNDIFEIEKGTCTLTTDEIRTSIVSCLDENIQIKRKKTEDEGDKRKRDTI